MLSVMIGRGRGSSIHRIRIGDKRRAISYADAAAAEIAAPS